MQTSNMYTVKFDTPQVEIFGESEDTGRICAVFRPNSVYTSDVCMQATVYGKHGDQVCGSSGHCGVQWVRFTVNTRKMHHIQSNTDYSLVMV